MIIIPFKYLPGRDAADLPAMPECVMKYLILMDLKYD
jgi:hypothetical protein